MENLIIRLAQPDEVHLVNQVVDAAYSKWIPVIGVKPMPMLADYVMLIAQHYVYVVVEGRRVAAVLVIWPTEDALYIDNIAVHPDYQRQIGRAHV